MRRLRPVLVGTGLLLLVGCSISESVKSSFESSSASLGSSSGSSASSSRERESYRNEVRDYTSAYVKSGGQYENFTRGLDSIAARHNVTNWEDDQDTYVGIGAGLKAANVTQAQFTVWQTNLAGSDATKAASMQKGFSQGR
ncbi:MAG TPA: putative lipoprotein [Candidatus Dormibacteraeota bacterium]|nr:putative lipoprotein [Candidatus Dormibacteraeota bacterium]